MSPHLARCMRIRLMYSKTVMHGNTADVQHDSDAWEYGGNTSWQRCMGVRRKHSMTEMHGSTADAQHDRDAWEYG